MKKGFTLVELLVVIAMLVILMGSISSGVMRARKRAKIERARVETREITNAILAYENHLKDGASIQEMNDANASKSSLAFLLGLGEEGQFGKIPVLYNAQFEGNNICDPWHMPYHVTIRKSTIKVTDAIMNGKDSIDAGVSFPNFNRRSLWGLP